MKISLSLANVRFGMLIFIGLVIFCLAQLSWWVIYQVNLNRELYQLRIDLIELKKESLTARINYDYRRIAELARNAYLLSDGDLGRLRQCFENLLLDPAVTGYRLLPDGAGRPTEAGILDSTFYLVVGAGHVLCLNPDYLHLLIDDTTSELIFSASGRNPGENYSWVRPDMFKVDPILLDRFRKEVTRGSIMFVSEGSFFILVMLFGAYLIFRTLRRSEDLKSQQVSFIQAVTHEFRTPLTSLRLYLESLEGGTVADDEARKLYGKMLTDCDRIDKMVTDVLQAGHLSRHRIELKLSATDFSCDVRDCLEEVMPSVVRQNGQLSYDLQDSIYIKSNHQAMNRVIRELIDNALKYSPPDRREIYVNLSKTKTVAILKVVDQGLGVALLDQSQIFERFYRVDSTPGRNIRGTGLGLYLVRHIVKAHGGSIAVLSEGADKGTTFTVRLPMLKA